MPPEDALNREVCYRALQTRDARFDGRVYTAVLSTGIYCRPICPARTPKLENCLFLPSAAAAHQLGYRPCLRCRPELAPGVAGFRGTANTVARALELITEGACDEAGFDELASRLGIGPRHLRRLFDRHVGASPASVAQAHRMLFARRLVAETSLSMTDVASAAGFGSVRRFNDAFQRAMHRSPTQLRRARREGAAAPGVVLQLPFTPPYDWAAMIDFLAARAIPGVEVASRERYARTFSLQGAKGTVEVRAPERTNALVAVIRTNDVRALGAVVTRLRRLFDLDADLAAIDGHLARDRRLAARVRARPGIRVPGAWDPFELAVRAVVGQQISVAAATTLAGRLVAALGGPLDPRLAGEGPRMTFPEPADVAADDLGAIGLTQARRAALRNLAAVVAADPDRLRASPTLAGTLEKLTAIPGIGAWTAHYIAMRALREPDAFPASDLGLLRAMETRRRGRPTPRELATIAEAWRPWRAYAALRLWTQ